MNSIIVGQPVPSRNIVEEKTKSDLEQIDRAKEKCFRKNSIRLVNRRRGGFITKPRIGSIAWENKYDVYDIGE